MKDNVSARPAGNKLRHLASVGRDEACYKHFLDACWNGSVATAPPEQQIIDLTEGSDQVDTVEFPQHRPERLWMDLLAVDSRIGQPGSQGNLYSLLYQCRCLRRIASSGDYNTPATHLFGYGVESKRA